MHQRHGDVETSLELGLPSRLPMPEERVVKTDGKERIGKQVSLASIPPDLPIRIPGGTKLLPEIGAFHMSECKELAGRLCADGSDELLDGQCRDGGEPVEHHAAECQILLVRH